MMLLVMYIPVYPSIMDIIKIALMLFVKHMVKHRFNVHCQPFSFCSLITYLIFKAHPTWKIHSFVLLRLPQQEILYLLFIQSTSMPIHISLYYDAFGLFSRRVPFFKGHIHLRKQSSIVGDPLHFEKRNRSVEELGSQMYGDKWSLTLPPLLFRSLVYIFSSLLFPHPPSPYHRVLLLVNSYLFSLAFFLFLFQVPLSNLKIFL